MGSWTYAIYQIGSDVSDSGTIHWNPDADNIPKLISNYMPITSGHATMYLISFLPHSTRRPRLDFLVKFDTRAVHVAKVGKAKTHIIEGAKD